MKAASGGTTMLTFICYPKCTTCQKAQALLDSFDVEYGVRDIKTDHPTYDELKAWLTLSESPVKKFFNMNGQLYKSLGLKGKLSSMSEDECLKLLSTDGMLVKRPLLVDDDGILVGFNSNEWESVLTDMTSVPNAMTIEMTDSNDIGFPFEWWVRLDFGHKFVQITLVGDKIAIHKPTAVGVEYTKPCKAGDNSYIRSVRLFDVRVPKQLFAMLGISSGDKIDLALEKNCISIRKHSDEPERPEPEPPEPIMAFCCVCGSLLYTSGLVKVSSKYICHECIGLVKTL
jgi:arsenate reductase